MKTDTLTTRVDEITKIEFTNVCEELGLSTSQAIKIFARAVINHGGIPFDLKIKEPNELTLKAMKEIEDGKGIKAKSVKELFKNNGIDSIDV